MCWNNCYLLQKCHVNSPSLTRFRLYGGAESPITTSGLVYVMILMKKSTFIGSKLDKVMKLSSPIQGLFSDKSKTTNICSIYANIFSYSPKHQRIKRNNLSQFLMKKNYWKQWNSQNTEEIVAKMVNLSVSFMRTLHFNWHQNRLNSVQTARKSPSKVGSKKANQNCVYAAVLFGFWKQFCMRLS